MREHKYVYTERGSWNPCAKRGRIKMDGRNGGRSERGAMSYRVEVVTGEMQIFRWCLCKMIAKGGWERGEEFRLLSSFALPFLSLFVFFFFFLTSGLSARDKRELRAFRERASLVPRAKFDLMALRVDRSWSVCGLALSKCRLVVFEWIEIEFLRFEVLSR